MGRVGKRRTRWWNLTRLRNEVTASNTFVLMFRMTYKAHPIIASLWLPTVDDWLQWAPMQQLPFSPFLFK